MLPITSRLKDALWSIRREFELGNDLDRIIRCIIFDNDISQDRLDSLFVSYPKRVPEDFVSALLARIQQIVRQYWAYCSTHKGYHKVLKGIYFLENVARYRFDKCILIEDKIYGFKLDLRSEYKKKNDPKPS